MVFSLQLWHYVWENETNSDNDYPLEATLVLATVVFYLFIYFLFWEDNQTIQRQSIQHRHTTLYVLFFWAQSVACSQYQNWNTHSQAVKQTSRFAPQTLHSNYHRVSRALYLGAPVVVLNHYSYSPEGSSNTCSVRHPFLGSGPLSPRHHKSVGVRLANGRKCTVKLELVLKL